MLIALLLTAFFSEEEGGFAEKGSSRGSFIMVEQRVVGGKNRGYVSKQNFIESYVASALDAS